jgi:hypothetical protein
MLITHIHFLLSDSGQHTQGILLPPAKTFFGAEKKGKRPLVKFD